MKTLTAAVIGDMHVGSKVGLWKPGHLGYEINSCQEYLYECWNIFWGQVVKADYVFLLSDLIDGYNRKEFGRPNVTTSLNEQIDCCVELLRPHVKGRKVITIAGSPYHGSLDVKIDQVIAEKMNEMPGTRAQFMGLMANLHIKKVDKHVRLCHKLAGGRFTKAALERESNSLDMAIGRGDLSYPVDVVLGAHYHRYEKIHSNNRLLALTPGWKAWFEYRTEYTSDHKRQFGGLILKMSEDECTIDPVLFPSADHYDRVQEI